QTEAHWDMAAERALPLLACVNKLDKDRASFLRALDDMEKTLNAKPVALQLPIGLGDSFSGVIDLITMRAHAYTRKTDGKFGVDDVAAAIVRYLPPPTVRREIKGKDGKNGDLVRTAQRDAPLTMLAFRNTVDHFVGRLSACRVFSGAVKHGTVIVNGRTGNSE